MDCQNISIERWLDIRIGRQIDRCINKQIDRQIDRQMDGYRWMGRWMDGQIDGQMDIQIEPINSMQIPANVDVSSNKAGYLTVSFTCGCGGFHIGACGVDPSPKAQSNFNHPDKSSSQPKRKLFGDPQTKYELQ